MTEQIEQTTTNDEWVRVSGERQRLVQPNEEARFQGGLWQVQNRCGDYNLDLVRGQDSTYETFCASASSVEMHPLPMPDVTIVESFRGRLPELAGTLGQVIATAHEAAPGMNGSREAMALGLRALVGEAERAAERYATLRTRSEEAGQRIVTLNQEIRNLRLAAVQAENAHRAELERIVDALHEEGNDRGWCSEYDDILERVGLPRRARNYDVNVTVTLSLTLTREARGADAAAEDLDDAIGEAIRYGQYEVDDWSVDGVEES